MDKIVIPDASFDFKELSLGHPTPTQGGAYFTQLLYNNKPLYIQTTKSKTKQGLVKHGKKYSCDLMFDNSSGDLINWFENIEVTCQKLLLSKSTAWFASTLESSDVENNFNSIIRIYKSGKFYLIRTIIKNTLQNEPSIKIYNEDEISLPIDKITTDTNIVSILEITGIKFTTKTFQIDICLRQIMVLDDEPTFENCLFKTNKVKTIPDNQTQDNNIELDEQNIYLDESTVISTMFNDSSNCLVENTDDTIIEDESIYLRNITDDKDIDEITLDEQTLDEQTIDNAVLDNQYLDNSALDNQGLDNPALDNQGLDNPDLDNQGLDNPALDNQGLENPYLIHNELKENSNIVFDTEELVDDYNDVKEVDLNIDNSLETITLKQPNQVYFELYKTAREKAKLAKRNALISYLEVKNIKRTYMLDNLNDSDSEFDAEIDEVSESELDCL